MKTFAVRQWTCVAVCLFLLSAGCKKKVSTEPVAPVTSGPASAPTPAPVASPPVADAEPAPVPPVTVDGVTIQATSGTGKSVEWAMKQDEIKNDPDGQWASGATASSSYGDAKEQQRFAPWQATGVPNVDTESDNPSAWTAKSANAGIEWLDLTFSKAVAATGLRIRESSGAGAIVKVELFDESGTAHTLWSGTNDPTRHLNYFDLSFAKTAYKTNHVKITLATNMSPGWHEIDAVQLLSSDK